MSQRFSRDQIIIALKDEREYQRRRWGARKPREGKKDDFLEEGMSLQDATVCAQHHLRGAMENLYLCEVMEDPTMIPGDLSTAQTLEGFRKLTAILVAAMEHRGDRPYEFFIGFSEVDLGSSTRGISFYLLKIESLLRYAGENASEDDVIAIGFRKAIGVAIACFEIYGIVLRDLSKEIINARDGKVA